MTLQSVPAGWEHQGSPDASVMTAAGLGGWVGGVFQDDHEARAH